MAQHQAPDHYANQAGVAIGERGDALIEFNYWPPGLSGDSFDDPLVTIALPRAALVELQCELTELLEEQ